MGFHLQLPLSSVYTTSFFWVCSVYVSGFVPSNRFWLCFVLAVTCESLVSREFSRFFWKFHFSISISRHFHFTFHSRSRSQLIFISLFILEKSERKTKFTFHFSKRVKALQIS